MGCKQTKNVPLKPVPPKEDTDSSDCEDSDISVEINSSVVSPSIVDNNDRKSTNDDYYEDNDEDPIDDDSTDIEVADHQAFNPAFITQRQSAIDNQAYRSTVDSWRPGSLQALVRSIGQLGKGKSPIDRYWIIFYWIATHIDYDTVSYFAKDYKDQTAEGVFASRKGVCAGYGNLFKHICDALEMSCEIISGYSKGYGFDDRAGAPPEIDHAWNVVKIFNHQYLIESTWGAGHLNDKKEFERVLHAYYFLPRPNEMIYHHLPKDEQWQLLRTPITLKEYGQMPQLRSTYFEMKLQLVQPHNRSYVDLRPGKPYALVIVKAPADVQLIADLALGEKKIVGGHQVIFDKRKRAFYCYFAPANRGKHKITIFARRDETETELYTSVLDLSLTVKRMPDYPINYPTTWKNFFDYGLKILSPLDTGIIHLSREEKSAQILLQTPASVELMGSLKDDRDEKVLGGDCIYFDRREKCWRCQFAPNRSGIFQAMIMAKKKSDPGSYTSTVEFQVNAEQFVAPSISFPNTWQRFYDYRMEILSPVDQGILTLRGKMTSVDVRLQAPDDVDLLGQLLDEKDEEISGGTQVYYDDTDACWHCNFAPNRKGLFNGTIMAKKKSDPGLYSSAVAFRIDATRIVSKPRSLLQTTQLFHDLKLKVIAPKDPTNIVLTEKSSYAEICIETAHPNVQLIGQLMDDEELEVPNANQVYYDQRRSVWRCRFAPNRIGQFKAVVLAKSKPHEKTYSGAVTFLIQAKHVPSPPLTFPETWQQFFDLDLVIQSPRSRAAVPWPKNASYAQVLMQAPDDVQLSCAIEYNGVRIEQGALAQFDPDKQLWQLLFAPEHAGEHRLIVFAKRISDEGTAASSVVTFSLSVGRLRRPIKFPVTYKQFGEQRCFIYTPIEHVLERNSQVRLHCFIPDAAEVMVTVDSKSIQQIDYADSVLQTDITVGSKEVAIHARYGQTRTFSTLIEYIVA